MLIILPRHTKHVGSLKSMPVDTVVNTGPPLLLARMDGCGLGVIAEE